MTLYLKEVQHQGFVTDIRNGTIAARAHGSWVCGTSGVAAEAYRHCTVPEPAWHNVHYLDRQDIIYYTRAQAEVTLNSLDEWTPSFSFASSGSQSRDGQGGGSRESPSTRCSTACPSPRHLGLKLAEMGIIFSSFSDAIFLRASGPGEAVPRIGWPSPTATIIP